ncbi:MAG TPA: alpha-glycosidase [Clostridiales bacterium]|nr:alpha-glycosidase [Clostridiales bacterium]
MYIFDNQSEFHRYPQGGIMCGHEIQLKIYVKKSSTLVPSILIEKRNNYDNIFYSEISMKWTGTEKGYDLYTCLFTINKEGHYFYSFVLKDNPADKNTLESIHISSSQKYELIIHSTDYSTPKWISGGIIYHIFVDRFYRTTALKKPHPANSAIEIRNDWGGTPHYLPDENGKIKNNDFFGGNLKGIEEKLPYLSELGVTVLYLSPIFDAYSNHKYDTGDYFTIDPMFGDENSLTDLCSHAEKLGIHIILDGVFSHTGADSIYFNKYGNYSSTGAYQSMHSPYYDWYFFNRWNDDYESWWGISTLPTVNKDCKSYVDFIAGKDGVLKHWQKKGIRGWRLDVADELPDDFLESLRNSVKSRDHEAFIVGEVWEDASNKFSYGILKEYFLGNQLDSVTNYPLKDAIIEYVRTGDCSILNYTINYIIEKYPPQTISCLMNILGTHDTARILTVLGSEKTPESRIERAEYKLDNEEKWKGVQLLKIASLLQFTLPGIPCIYYGDEAGVEGFEDPFNRACFPWGNENAEIINHYKFLSVLRKSKLFANGKYKNVINDKEVFAFERYDECERIIIAANMSEEDVTLNIAESMVHYPSGKAGRTFTLNSRDYLILNKTIQNNNNHQY